MKGFILLTLLLILCFQSAHYATLLQEGDQIRKAENEIEEAFKALKNAETARAREEELAELTSRLNEAITLLEMVKRGEAEVSDNLPKVMELSETVISEARELEIRASKRFFWIKIVLFASIPVISAIVAFSLNHLYEWWHKREIERTLKMIIKRREMT